MDVTDFAAIECRAMQLRNQRNAMTDSINLLQDAVYPVKKTDTVLIKKKLLAMIVEKEKLVAESLLLADSIKILLDKILEDFSADKNKEATFNRQLDTALKAKGCK